MKISILLKPRKTWISWSLNNYHSTNYNQWNWEINKNLLVDRCSIDEAISIYEEYTHIVSDYSLILWVSIKNWMDEFKKIEALFNID